MLNFGNKEFRNLQEQVLKNAQDIETLKGRENLQIVIVEELPETGNPNYIYLVPNEEGEESNVYNEYIWLADEETYEQIGAVNIDLTNYVTTDTEQTITGSKTFSSNVLFGTTNSPFVGRTLDNRLYLGANGGVQVKAPYGFVFEMTSGSVRTVNNEPKIDLGDSTHPWKDLYLGGNINFGSNGAGIKYDEPNYRLIIKTNGGYEKYIFGDTFYTQVNILPTGTKTYSLGSATALWLETYTNYLNDGTHQIKVENIASKVTSTFISGTFDANGETTIDTEQEGTPEGLFIFTYGNCQCFLRLTATMVQNADTAPIRVACPMIYNSDPVNGWLNITRAGYILILTITDGTNHVDSGYSWTLTKTNLL